MLPDLLAELQFHHPAKRLIRTLDLLNRFTLSVVKND